MASKALLSPKVVVIEQDPVLRAILGVPTAVTAVLGVFERGPERVPTLITSPAEFRRVYGSFITAGRGPELIDGFFNNGGQVAYVSRTLHYTDPTDNQTGTGVVATFDIIDSAAVATLQCDAKYFGTWGNDLQVTIADATNGDVEEFDLEVIEDGISREIFNNVSMDDTHARYVETIINAIDGTGSDYITVTDLDSITAPPGDRPANITASLASGDDGLTGIVDSDFTGDEGAGTGFHAFDQIETIRLLLCSEQHTVAVHQKMQDYCEVSRLGSMFAVLEVPQGSTAAAAITYQVTTAALKDRSEYSMIVWPWVKIPNPSTAVYGTTLDGTITVPPSGIIAGMFARQDGSRQGGVYIAAAGTERGILRGVTALETDEALESVKADLVYPENINIIRKRANSAIILDGSKTTKIAGAKFGFFPQRRGVIFIELSLQAGLQFIPHTNNNRTLRAQVERSIQLFLIQQMRDGAFASDEPDKAFTVDADIPGTGINSASNQFAGKFTVDVGLAMVTPAQFVTLRISPDQRAILEELEEA